MGAYLSVAAGSHVPPRFVEVEYSGGRDGEAPFAIVGKGITFDTWVYYVYISYFIRVHLSFSTFCCHGFLNTVV